jgi:hypothetical protein
MNDKVRELLENAEQSDAIARNKWRIENREQLRKERKEKLKELMEKDKPTLIEQFVIECGNYGDTAQISDEVIEKFKEVEKEQKEMSYDDGYAEGYKRAIELTKWAISNLIPPHNESNP